NFGSARRCAFEDDGWFTPENWNCATVTALMDAADDLMQEIYGNDETMQVIPYVDECEGNGWIILTRYKHRGSTSSAVYVGDFWPPKPLTLDRAERAIPELETRRKEWEAWQAERVVRKAVALGRAAVGEG